MPNDTDPLDVIRRQAVAWVHRWFAGQLSAEELAEFECWQQADPRNQECVRMCMASYWAERMKDGDIDPGSRAIFTRWLLSDPRNKEEFTCAVVLFLTDEPREVRRFSRPAQWVASSVDRSSPIRKWLPVGLAAGILLSGIATWAWFERPFSHGVVFATRTGETRSVALSDGSNVTLNTQTRITWDPGRDERRLRLDSGEVYLSVTHDVKRPFVVVSDTGTVRVVGTHFDVYRNAGTGLVTVSVLDGKVEISCAQPAAETAGCERNLGKNQQVIFARTRIVTEVHEISASDVVRWRNGEMAVSHAVLSDVIGDLARYTDTPIRVIDPDRRLASVHVVAFVRLRVSDVSGALQELERSGMPISVEGHEGREFVVRYRDDKEGTGAER